MVISHGQVKMMMCVYRPYKGGWVMCSECWASVLPSHTF